MNSDQRRQNGLDAHIRAWNDLNCSFQAEFRRVAAGIDDLMSTVAGSFRRTAIELPEISGISRAFAPMFDGVRRTLYELDDPCRNLVQSLADKGWYLSLEWELGGLA
jgi:hypothetical protein